MTIGVIMIEHRALPGWSLLMMLLLSTTRVHTDLKTNGYIVNTHVQIKIYCDNKRRHIEITCITHGNNVVLKL